MQQRLKLPPAQSGLQQETFPTYNLRWEKLKAYLEARFPAHKFQERRVRHSQWLQCVDGG